MKGGKADAGGPDRRDWSAPGDDEKLVINDTKGVVEIPLKQFVSLMLRTDRLLQRIDALLEVVVPELLDADDKNRYDRIALEDFLGMAMQYLDESDKSCGLFRHLGKWRHVRRDGRMRGSWLTVDDALEETHCHNKCDAAMFGAA